jgi:hypothetical protein
MSLTFEGNGSTEVKATARLIAACSMDIIIADDSRWDTSDQFVACIRTARLPPIAPKF